jgi:serine phosphatase RsbU (regulator of sigma subunit)
MNSEFYQQSKLLGRYRRLYEYTDDIIFILNTDGFVLENNERVENYFSQGTLGKNIKSLFEGIDIPIESLFQGEIVQSVFAHAANYTGKKGSFLLSFIPVEIDKKNREIMVIGRDLSEVESYKEEISSLRSRIDSLEEERRLFDSVKKGNDKMLTLANTLKKLERTKGELEKRNQTLTKELELAAKLQQSLVPHQLPEDSQLQFAFHYEPMQFVGGDYYDIMDLGYGKKGFIIADVSGHGVSSAFIAAMMKISFMNYATKLDSPAAVLSRLNNEYCDVIQTGDFVTAFYGVIDPQQNCITYCGAGHPRPLFYHHQTGETELLASEGFFLGMFDKAEYTDKEVKFHVGDRFVAYTDGVIEAYSDERGEQFGEERLLNCFNECSDQALDSLVAKIIDDVKIFMNKSIFYDDLAIAAIEYRKR